jgi:outer membrane protein assembly factor BamB
MPAFVWRQELHSKGLGGVAATREYVIVSDRELNDTTDVFRCLRADTGQEAWAYRYPAPGQLDYGNSPRATPVIDGGLVYVHGAFGHVACVKLDTGEPVWELNTHDEFEPAETPKWGTCSTPLLVDGKLIVNPGAKDASLVALDAKTGKVLWKAPGKAAGYGSLIAGTFGGRKQIVGHDADSLGGWDPQTGKRLWRLVPDRPNDFNVPTPIPVGDKLLVATENNGTRLYAFGPDGKIVPKPVAANRQLAPDTHTPVVAAGRVFGVWRRLYCLSLADGLKPVWDSDDKAFAVYGSAVTDGKRVLILTLHGELILFDAAADELAPLGRLKLFDDDKGVYAHPAFVGGRVYIRGSAAVVCLDLPAK